MSKMKKISLAVMLFSSVMSVTSPLLGQKDSVYAEETAQVVPAKEYRNVMYYGDWSIWDGEGKFLPQDIPADQLTHLNFAFLDFDSEGNLTFTDADAAVGASLEQPGVGWNTPSSGILNAIQDLRGKNKNLKIGVSLGGWSKSGDFS
ncbi:MAG: glycosyl hydrolase family 18 protein, partial [Enterococcus faecium]